jgi:hypothetical protein
MKLIGCTVLAGVVIGGCVRSASSPAPDTRVGQSAPLVSASSAAKSSITAALGCDAQHLAGTGEWGCLEVNETRTPMQCQAEHAVSELLVQLQCCHYRVRAANGRLVLHLKGDAGTIDHIDAEATDALAADDALLECLKSQMSSIAFPNCGNTADIVVAVTFRPVCWL